MSALSLSPLHLVNTRPVHQAGVLTALLCRLGANVFEFPTLAIIPAEQCQREQIETELSRLERSDWVIFTSSNGVIQTFSIGAGNCLVREQGLIAALKTKKIAVIGEGTRETLEQYNVTPSFVGQNTSSEEFSENFLKHLFELGELTAETTKRALLLRAELGNPALAQGLIKAGLEVTSVVVYRSVLPLVEKKKVLELTNFLGFDRREELRPPSGILFLSSESARNIFRVLEGFSGALPNSWMSAILKLPAFVIGPVTAKTVRELGFTTVVRAARATNDDLVNSVVDYVEQQKRKLSCASQMLLG